MGRKTEEQKRKEETAKYRNRWQKEKTKLYGIRFSVTKEADIIAKLDAEKSKKNYIADLIRADIQREEKKED